MDAARLLSAVLTEQVKIGNPLPWLTLKNERAFLRPLSHCCTHPQSPLTVTYGLLISLQFDEGLRNRSMYETKTQETYQFSYNSAVWSCIRRTEIQKGKRAKHLSSVCIERLHVSQLVQPFAVKPDSCFVVTPSERFIPLLPQCWGSNGDRENLDAAKQKFIFVLRNRIPTVSLVLIHLPSASSLLSIFF